MIGKLQEIGTAHLAFIAFPEKGVKGEDLPADEYERRIEEMGKKAEGIAALARQRLTELEKPI